MMLCVCVHILMSHHQTNVLFQRLVTISNCVCMSRAAIQYIGRELAVACRWVQQIWLCFMHCLFRVSICAFVCSVICFIVPPLAFVLWIWYMVIAVARFVRFLLPHYNVGNIFLTQGDNSLSVSVIMKVFCHNLCWTCSSQSVKAGPRSHNSRHLGSCFPSFYHTIWKSFC